MSDYRALYRKWRPRNFDEVSGQNGITDILKYEVENDKLSHAYLFCGSRGTGKTSCAKILAKAVNCLNPINGNPCNKCAACRSIDEGTTTDVIEMDAASNNGVDNVRDMIDEIAFTPAELKHRVYIIDEVHMMSASAFNALLKTLEEPPTYVVFILATTEFHKIPTTIVSRCQRFDFKRITNSDIVSRLQLISKEENIDLTEDAAKVLARLSRGGMRDAISLLELCATSDVKIDEKHVFETVGTGNRENTYKLINAILKKDYSTVYKTVSDVVNSSGDLSVFWQEVIDSYRDIMVVKNCDKAKEYLDLTDNEYSDLRKFASAFTPAKLYYHVSILENSMADMQRAFNSKRSIAEIALTKMCDAKTELTVESLADRVADLEKEVSMLKLGVASNVNLVDNEDVVKVLPTVKADEVEDIEELDKVIESSTVSDNSKENAEQKTENVEKPVKKKTVPYMNWMDVIERIGQLKPRLSSQLQGSKSYLRPDGSYLIRMSSFFAETISQSDTDLAILRGVIAEVEKTTPNNVKMIIEPLDTSNRNDFADEIEEQIY